MTKRTPLYHEHLDAGGKMVDFAGWEMPLHFGSQLEEHKQVRAHAGMFDVSHMTVVDITGNDAESWLRRLAANDVAKLKVPGKALYGVLLNEQAGILDDLIIYRREHGYRAVVNAATRDRVLAWMGEQAAGFDVSIDEWADKAMIAVQGPQALAHFVEETAIEGVGETPPFGFLEKGNWLIARTGYTGEAGVEVILPGEESVDLWRGLSKRGVEPIGLGARDTLRLEAGLNLYGQDRGLESTGTGLHRARPACRHQGNRRYTQTDRRGADGKRCDASWSEGTDPGGGRGSHQWYLLTHPGLQHRAGSRSPGGGRNLRGGNTQQSGCRTSRKATVCTQWKTGVPIGLGNSLK